MNQKHSVLLLLKFFFSFVTKSGVVVAVDRREAASADLKRLTAGVGGGEGDTDS